MQYLQPRREENKLEAALSDFFAIDEIRLLNNGLYLVVVDEEGNEEAVCYRGLEELKKDFNVLDRFREVEDRRKSLGLLGESEIVGRQE